MSASKAIRLEMRDEDGYTQFMYSQLKESP